MKSNIVEKNKGSWREDFHADFSRKIAACRREFAKHGIKPALVPSPLPIAREAMGLGSGKALQARPRVRLERDPEPIFRTVVADCIQNDLSQSKRFFRKLYEVDADMLPDRAETKVSKVSTDDKPGEAINLTGIVEAKG